jgi:hypothetical protein
METNIDRLIFFYEKFTDNKIDMELDEQDAPEPSSGGGTSTPSSSVPKWADLYALKRGKANMLGKGGEKWSTGLNRGLANQIW